MSGHCFIENCFQPILVSKTSSSVTLMLPFRNELIGNAIIPCLHGGVVAAMIERTGKFAARVVACDDPAVGSVDLGQIKVIDMRVDFLEPAPCENIYFDATIIHKSKKLVRVDVDCWNYVRSKRIAIGRGIYSLFGS